MKLKYIRLNLQEILIISESGSTYNTVLNEGDPVGAIHRGNKTIFLKKGIYYGDPSPVLRHIDKNLPDIDITGWKILYSPDSFGLNEWDDETQSHLSLGEISYRHLPKADKDARKVDTNTLPEVKPDGDDTDEDTVWDMDTRTYLTRTEVKPIKLTGEFPEPEEIEESH